MGKRKGVARIRGILHSRPFNFLCAVAFKSKIWRMRIGFMRFPWGKIATLRRFN